MTAQLRSQYCELPPPRALSDRLVCVWTQSIEDGGGEYRQSVLPDGCVDIVWIGEAAPVVAGPATRHIDVGLPAGTSLIGVRFQPGWATSSLGLPVDQLLNQSVPLAEIWGRGAERLTEQVFKRHSVSARLRELIEQLMARFENVSVADPATQAAVAWLVRHPAGRVHDLARSIGFSDRQLQRRFRSAVGHGPKTFQRIMRLQRLLALCPTTDLKPPSPAGLAVNLGYADQAHMCREVRALADETPQTLLASFGSTLSMSDLFNTARLGNN